MNDADFAGALLPLVIGEDPGTVPSERDWNAWQMAARFHRVVPLLYQLVGRYDTDLSDDNRQRLRQLQADAMAWAVRVEHAVLQTAPVLERNGLRWAVLKGVATAHLDYPDPAWRQFGDADVLVLPRDFRSVSRLVIEAGWRQGYELPRHHERFTHAITFTRGDLELDVHQRLGHRAVGQLIPTEELLTRRTTFEIASTQLWALSDVDRLIHAAVHAVMSRGTTKRLSSVADVLLLAHRQAPSSDAVLERADQWGVGSLVRPAIRHAYTMAGVAPPHYWASAPPGPRSRLLAAAYLSDRRHPLLEELIYLRLLDGWSDRSRYVSGHLRGGPTHTAALGVRRKSQPAYLWSKVRQRR